LPTCGNLKQYAIKLALLEVNALSDFTVTVVPEKTGLRVTGVLIGCGRRTLKGAKRPTPNCKPRVGRKARITGTVEGMLPLEVIE
jgi:hypothetical protein